MKEVLTLHGGEALWVIFYPGLLIFVFLLVAGIVFIRRGFAPARGDDQKARESLQASAADAGPRRVLPALASLDRYPASRSVPYLSVGGFLVLLALLFLGWCHHIGFLA
jgi:hypothetical protein